MTREMLEKELTALLRDTALEGSERSISLSEPLGEQGIGLDSLGFVQFITALENAFQIEIPEDFWLEANRVSLQILADYIMSNDRPTAPSGAAPIPSAPAGDKPPVRLEQRTSAPDRGWWGNARRMPARAWRRLRRSFYHRDKMFILEFNLIGESIPTFRPPPGVEFREATPDDLPATEGLWPKRVRERKRRLFQERLVRRYKCYTAWLEDRIVAIDWAATTDDNEPKTGLHIKLNPGTCYGLDLDEHPDYRGQGLGLAILAYSLQRCKEQGNHCQYTIVHADNEKMLRAAIQLFGYRRVGDVHTRRVLWRKSTTWRIDDRRGTGPVLEL